MLEGVFLKTLLSRWARSFRLSGEGKRGCSHDKTMIITRETEIETLCSLSTFNPFNLSGTWQGKVSQFKFIWF